MNTWLINSGLLALLCCAQTSSISYPMVMAQRYFKAQSNVPGELITRADKHLASAYKKLTSFETSTQVGDRARTHS